MMETPQKLSFPKSERLTHKESINRLYKTGKLVKHFPIKLLYLNLEDSPELGVKSVISVPKRLHKKAVDRNLIKRRIREVHRRQLPNLKMQLQNHRQGYAVMIVYLGKDIVPYSSIEKAYKACLKQMIDKINESAKEN